MIMKRFKEQSYVVYMRVSQINSKPSSISLCDTTFDEVIKCANNIAKEIASPIKQGIAITVQVREYEEKKFIRTKQFQFYGSTPEKFIKHFTEKYLCG